jgi:hypothetical protein
MVRAKFGRTVAVVVDGVQLSSRVIEEEMARRLQSDLKC